MYRDALAFEAALIGMHWVDAQDILATCAGMQGRVSAIESLVVPALERIGQAWEAGQLALAQVYMAGRICEAAVDHLLKQDEHPNPNAPVIGLGILLDHHQLGKRVVSSVLKSGGYRVIDYGAGLEPADLAKKALEDQVPLIMVSGLTRIVHVCSSNPL